MNTSTKTIVVVAVVALLAVAAVGLGLAYTAETENSQNTAGQEFWLTAGVKEGSPSGAQEDYKGAYEDGIEYKTKNMPSSSVAGSFDITYTIVPTITIDDIQGQQNVPVAVLGHFPVQVSAPANEGQKPGASGQTYTIQVSFPADSADGRLTFYAQAVASDWNGTTEQGKGFQKTDTNIYKMVKHSVDNVEVYDAYLPVNADVLFYSVYIGVSSGTGSFTQTVATLPTTTEKVLNNTTVTILADHDSLAETGKSFYRFAQASSDKTSLVLNEQLVDPLAKISVEQLYFGDTAFAAATSATAGKYVLSLDTDNALVLSIATDGMITYQNGKSYTDLNADKDIKVTVTFYDSDWTSDTDTPNAKHVLEDAVTIDLVAPTAP